MGQRSFANISTTTKGKIDTDARTIDLIGHQQTNKFCVFMIGCPEGTDRHVDDNIALGYEPNQQIAYEWNLECYEALVEYNEAQPKHRQITIIYGDLVAGLKRVLDKGVKIGYVDFDSTSTFGACEFELIKLFKQGNIETLRLIGSTRKYSPELIAYANKHRIPRTWACRNHTYKWGHCSKAIRAHVVRGLDVETIEYKGRSPMYLMLLTNEV